MKMNGVVLYKNPTLLIRGGEAVVVGYDISQWLTFLNVKPAKQTVSQGSSPLFYSESTRFSIRDLYIDAGYNGEIIIQRPPRAVILRREKDYHAKVFLRTEVAVYVDDEYGPHGSYLNNVKGVKEKKLNPGELGFIVEYDTEKADISEIISNHSWSYDDDDDEATVQAAVYKFCIKLFRASDDRGE